MNDNKIIMKIIILDIVNNLYEIIFIFLYVFLFPHSYIFFDQDVKPRFGKIIKEKNNNI